MCSDFETVVEHLPPFQEFLEHIYEKKSMSTVEKSKTKKVQMALLRDELFHPAIEDNVSSADLVEELACIAVEAFLQELRDPKKQHINISRARVLNFRTNIVRR